MRYSITRLGCLANGGGTDFAVSVSRITIAPCVHAVPDLTPQCTSACSLLAQGAAHRRLTHVGLHSAQVRVQTGKNVWEDQGETEKGAAAIRKYMTEMGATEATIRTIEETNFDEIQDFFFDPTMPAADQEITKLGFYSTEDQYFSSVGMPYPNTVVFTRNSIYQQNAAEYGSIQASRDLAIASTKYRPNEKPDFEAAIRALEMGVAKGDGWSMHNLGYHYSYGLGVPKDNSKAVELYLKASKLGVAASQNNLGWAYYTGVGVPESLPDAIYWITKSAEQGEAFAYGSLCEIHGATDLFKNDPTEAFMWCGLAVEHLPDGDAKDAAQAVYDELMKTASAEVVSAGAVQVQRWDAEHITTSMRNVGDDLN